MPRDATVAAGGFVLPSTRSFGAWVSGELARLGVSHARFDYLLGLDGGMTADLVAGGRSPTLDEVMVIVTRIDAIESRGPVHSEATPCAMAGGVAR